MIDPCGTGAGEVDVDAVIAALDDATVRYAECRIQLETARLELIRARIAQRRAKLGLPDDPALDVGRPEGRQRDKPAVRVARAEASVQAASRQLSEAREGVLALSRGRGDDGDRGGWI